MRLLLIALLAVCAQAADLPVTVTAGDARLSWSGRWHRAGDAATARWSGAALRFACSGDAVQLATSCDGDNRWQIVIDGKPTTVIALPKGDAVTTLAEGLGQGRHEVEIFKATEAFTGWTTVRGLRLAAGSDLQAVTLRTHRIECVGDSITAGYGIEAASGSHGFSPATENAWLTYGAIAARRLAADYSSVCWSGGWLMEGGGERVPPKWLKTDPWGADWDFASHPVDAVIVNLGTNDAGRKPWDGAGYRRAWTTFLGDIRARQPKALILATIGPMGRGPDGDMERAIDEVVAALADPRIAALRLADQQVERDGIGSDWHPSRRTQEIMADALVAALQQHLAWR